MDGEFGAFALVGSDRVLRDGDEIVPQQRGPVKGH